METKEHLLMMIEKAQTDLETFKTLLAEPKIVWVSFGTEKEKDIKRFLLSIRKRVFRLTNAIKSSRAFKGDGWLD